jgi:hypothetical protein
VVVSIRIYIRLNTFLEKFNFWVLAMPVRRRNLYEMSIEANDKITDIESKLIFKSEPIFFRFGRFTVF